MIIRSATLTDAARIQEIYAYYVENTAVTFEYEAPSLTEVSARMTNTLEKYPFLVVEEEGVVKGFTYAGPLRTRPAYDYCCETTIYLDHDAKRRGYGRALYEELESQLAKMGILNLYACIGDPLKEDEYLTRDSEQFHTHLGYTVTGRFHKCGYKFGHWYNVIWMEKIIGEHTEPEDC